MELTIVKKEVKAINIKVKPTGEVVLTIPSNTTQEYIDKIIKKREKWIKEQLEFFKANHIKDVKKEYVSGESTRYLGKIYRLKIFEAIEERVKFYRGYIHIYVNDRSDKTRIKKLLDSWYKQQAKKVFGELLNKYQEITRQSINKFTIREMTLKWGSCSIEKRNINLNIKLIEKPKYCIESVILHELAHLKYPYHTKEFFNYLLVYMPDYEWRKERLEKN